MFRILFKKEFSCHDCHAGVKQINYIKIPWPFQDMMSSWWYRDYWTLFVGSQKVFPHRNDPWASKWARSGKISVSQTIFRVSPKPKIAVSKKGGWTPRSFWGPAYFQENIVLGKASQAYQYPSFWVSLTNTKRFWGATWKLSRVPIPFKKSLKNLNLSVHSRFSLKTHH